ncbi:amidase [Candidatus Ferrigenium straubiae]|jgi:amidase|uniref:amidase n=1 Tax=Candidatus Ferrigenium straubiae TaxID=2919506 RepID=UPI003F4AF69A
MKPVDTCNAFVPGEMITVSPTKEGKLSSLTFAVKELYDVEGFVTGAGNPRWKSTHPVAQTTAPAVERLLNEGATLLGKTISDEMAFSLDGENFHYGTPLNSKCPDRIPGGSSSGSASAVAGGLVDFALGTDTAGSMRIPASYCGIYGIRTTHGAASLQGVYPMAPSFDAAGWFAHTPEMMARVGGVMLGRDIPEFNARRLLIARDLFATQDAELATKFDTFISGLSRLGIETAEIELGKPDFATWIETLRNIQWWELNEAHGAWISQNLDAFGAEIRGRLEKISTVSRSDMEEKRLIRKQLIEQIEGIVSPGTLVVFPTAAGVAPLKGRSIEEARAGRLNTMRHTCIAAVAGLPQVSMPLLEKDGCPLGISLLGARGQDGQLLAAAQLFGKG